MIRVGLTGGIGSGKSTVASLLAARGAVVVDADALAREAVAPETPGLAAVVAEFGPDVLAADGGLDRGRLGRLVFGDPDRLAALESIVHPYVARRSAELIAAAPPDAVVVYDVPLLVEKRLHGDYDVVVVVEAAEQTRLRRLSEARGMSESEARDRMAAQATPEQRRAVADVVIDNDGDVTELEQRVGLLWQRLRDQGPASRVSSPRSAG
jgi:dephospho-CoA kinase